MIWSTIAIQQVTEYKSLEKSSQSKTAVAVPSRRRILFQNGRGVQRVVEKASKDKHTSKERKEKEKEKTEKRKGKSSHC